MKSRANKPQRWCCGVRHLDVPDDCQLVHLASLFKLPEETRSWQSYDAIVFLMPSAFHTLFIRSSLYLPPPVHAEFGIYTCNLFQPSNQNKTKQKVLQTVSILMRRLIMSRLIRIYTVCNSFDFWLTPVWNNGSDHIERWKSLLQRVRDEKVKARHSTATCLFLSFKCLRLISWCIVRQDVRNGLTVGLSGY